MNIFFYKVARKIERLCGRIQGKGFMELSAETQNAVELLEKETGALVIFDCGANKGDWALSLKEHLLDNELNDFEFFLFEPSKTNIDIITDKIKDDNKMTLIASGVSNKKEKMTLYSNESGSALGSLYQRNLEHYNKELNIEEEITLITLDAYIKEQSIQKIDFLKLDIEGHESKALEGAKKTFKDKKVKYVQFEFGGCNIDSRTYFRDFFYFFKEHDYSLFRLTPFGLFPINRYHESEESFIPCNYIAIAN